MTETLSKAKIAIRNLRREDLDEIIRIDSMSTGFPRNSYFKRKFDRIFGEDH